MLAEAPGASANASVLHSAVQALGHAVTREQVLQALGYLEGLAAVATEQVGRVTVAALREAGQNHLSRLGAPLPGVKVPALP